MKTWYNRSFVAIVMEQCQILRSQ